MDEDTYRKSDIESDDGATESDSATDGADASNEGEDDDDCHEDNYWKNHWHDHWHDFFWGDDLSLRDEDGGKDSSSSSASSSSDDDDDEDSVENKAIVDKMDTNRYNPEDQTGDSAASGGDAEKNKDEYWNKYWHDFWYDYYWRDHWRYHRDDNDSTDSTSTTSTTTEDDEDEADIKNIATLNVSMCTEDGLHKARLNPKHGSLKDCINVISDEDGDSSDTVAKAGYSTFSKDQQNARHECTKQSSSNVAFKAKVDTKLNSLRKRKSEVKIKTKSLLETTIL